MEVFSVLGYFNNLNNYKKEKEMFQNTILEFDKYGFLGAGRRLQGVRRKIILLAAIFNMKKDIGDYRYHIVISNGEVEVKPVVFYKNLISEFGIFLNEEDCRKIINDYRENILNYQQNNIKNNIQLWKYFKRTLNNNYYVLKVNKK